jgi:hypothetical protein
MEASAVMTPAVDNNLQSLAKAANTERIAYDQLEKAQNALSKINSLLLRREKER